MFPCCSRVWPGLILTFELKPCPEFALNAKYSVKWVRGWTQFHSEEHNMLKCLSAWQLLDNFTFVLCSFKPDTFCKVCFSFFWISVFFLNFCRYLTLTTHPDKKCRNTYAQLYSTTVLLSFMMTSFLKSPNWILLWKRKVFLKSISIPGNCEDQWKKKKKTWMNHLKKMPVNCLAPMCVCPDLLKWYKSVIQGLVTIFFYYGSKIGSTVRHAARNGTYDINIWLGVDSEWQVDYLFHSSLGDSLSILDRILWKGSLWWNLISGLRDTVMFLHELPQLWVKALLQARGAEE